MSGASRTRVLQLVGDPKIRGWVAQIAFAALLAWLVWFLVGNVLSNIASRKLTSGFGFLWSTAGFDIDQTLISWSPRDSFGRALLVGILNTLIVAALGILLASVLGAIVALMQLSRNGLARSLARCFVEFVRNTPELLQIIFWYFAVLQTLPVPRQSLKLGESSFLNVRGLYLPYPAFSDGGLSLLVGAVLAAVASIMLALFMRRNAAAPRLWPPIALVLGVLLLTVPAMLAAGVTVTWSLPQLRGFNFIGGFHIYPEFIALLLGLSIYSAAFIAEIIRAGIIGIDRGQGEAAKALGLRDSLILRLVIVPQALRIIVPPLISEYASLVKGTSLAVAISYPDIVQIFAGTVLNQSGQAMEVMMITMALYLTFSLLISLLMNWYNRRLISIGMSR